MKRNVLTTLGSTILFTQALMGQAPPQNLDACRIQNEALAQEVQRLKAEIERLNGAVLVLSKQLGSAPTASPAAAPPPAKVGNARLKVTITTKFNTGQQCSITVDEQAAGRIDYPTIEGKGTVMEYSSGFLDVAPGDHRVKVTCAQVDGKKSSSVYTDQTFAPGEEYLFQTKINIWSKVLQQVSFSSR